MVKLYLPIPYGPWGLVLAGDRDQDGPFLLAVAFGECHPQRRPSVYDIAHYVTTAPGRTACAPTPAPE